MNTVRQPTAQDREVQQLRRELSDMADELKRLRHDHRQLEGQYEEQDYCVRRLRDVCIGLIVQVRQRANMSGCESLIVEAHGIGRDFGMEDLENA